MDNMTGLAGVEVGRDRFTDLDYADDMVLPVRNYDELVHCLTQFSLSAGVMGFNVSWSKTKIQCHGKSSQLSDVFMQSQGVELVDRFCYLGSVQDSDGISRPDILLRLGITITAMGSLSRVWTLSRVLYLGTKLRIYHTCILPIALYG